MARHRLRQRRAHRPGREPRANQAASAFSPNYITTNNEVCANYLAASVDGTFLMSSGGKDYVGRPFVPGDNAFKKPFASLQIQP